MLFRSYPRGGEDTEIKFEKHKKIELGKSEILRCLEEKEFVNLKEKNGKFVTIVAIGKMVARAVKMAENLKKDSGINAEVINARFLKPFDDVTILNSLEKTKNVITIEDGTKINGLATVVKELIVDNNLKDINLKVYAYPDEFITHGNVDELEKIYLK